MKNGFHHLPCFLLLTVALLVLAVPAKLKAGLVVQLDAANYSGTATGVWSDTSGNANHANQTFPERRPALILNATPSGAAALQWPNPGAPNATGFNLTTALSGTQFTSAPAFTAIVVAKSDPAKYLTPKAFFGGANGSPALRINGVANNSDGSLLEGLCLTSLNTFDIISLNSVVDPVDFHVFTMTVDSVQNSLTIRVDGTAVASQALNGRTFSSGISFIGGGYPGSQDFSGLISAVYLYDRVLSPDEMIGMERHLAATYLAPRPVVQLDAANYSGTSTGVWPDASGNANHANQTYSTRRPSLVPNATPSGAAALQWPNPGAPNATGFSLTTALSGSQYTSAPAFTAVVIAKSDPAKYLDAKAFFGGANGSPALRINGVGNNSDGSLLEGICLTKVNTSDFVTVNSVVDPTDFHVFAVTVDSAQNSLTIRVDGTAVASQALNGRTFTNGISFIGGGFPGSQIFSGLISAVYLYDHALSAGEIQAVESLATAKYLEPAPALKQSARNYYNHHIFDPSVLENIQSFGNLAGRPGLTSTSPVAGWFDYAVYVPTSGWYEFLVNWDTEVGDYQNGTTGIFYPYTWFIIDPGANTPGTYLNSATYSVALGQIKPGNVWLSEGTHTIRLAKYCWMLSFIPITGFEFKPLASSFATNLRVEKEEDGGSTGAFYLPTSGTIPLTVQTGGNSGGTFTAQVRNKSGGAVVSSTSVVFASSTAGTLLSSTLNVLAPATEGQYYLTYQANGATVATNVNLLPVQFYTIDTAPVTSPTNTLINKVLIQTIDCATTSPNYEGGTGGSSQVVNAGFGSYRQSGTNGYANYSHMNATDCSWFAYTLPAVTTSQLYLLEMDYPDDASRSFVTEVRQSNKPYLVRGCGLETGAPYCSTTGTMQTQSMFFWARNTEAPRVVFVNYQEGKRAACSQIRLYQVTGELPWLISGTGAGRSFGHYYEEPFAFTAAYADGGAASTTVDYRTAIERWAKMLKYVGGDTMWVTSSCYGQVLFPSRNYQLSFVPPNTPDYFKMILLVAKKYGLEVIADFHPRSDTELFEMLNDIPSDEYSHLAMNKNGSTVANLGSPSSNPTYNPLHPVNQAWLTGMLSEFASRYKNDSAFHGLSLRQMTWQNPGLNNFHSMDWGYDAYTAALFAQNGGPSDPGTPQSRYSSYTGSHLTAWTNFRNAQIRTLHSNLVSALKTVKSDIQVYSGVTYPLGTAEGVSNISDISGFKYVYAKHQYGNKGSSSSGWATNRLLLTNTANLLQFASSRSYMPWAQYAEDGGATVPNTSIGLTGSSAWLSGHLVPSYRNNLERYALIMAYGDAALIMNGGNDYFIDQPITQEFVKEYKQLPSSPFGLAPGSSTTANVVVRQQTVESNTTMFYAVNCTSVSQVATITFSADTSGTRPATGDAWNTTGANLNLSLQPFQMITYTVSGASAHIINVTSQPLAYQGAPINMWKQEVFGALSKNPNVSGETVVNNEAGIPNLMSYALAVNPYTATVRALPQCSMTTLAGMDYLTLSFSYNPSATDITYTVEGSADLGESNWTPLNTFRGGTLPNNNLAETSHRVTVYSATPMSSSAKGFMRLRVDHEM